MSPLTPPDVSGTEARFDSFSQTLANTFYQIRTRPLRNNWLRLAALWFLFGAPKTITWIQENLGSWKDKPLPLSYTYWYWGILVALLLATVVIKYRELWRADRLPPPEPLQTGSPIKGLLAFDFQDADLFKNLQRQSDVTRLRDALLNDAYRLGVLVGVSGCGKTSLLRAGLAPNLRSTAHTCVVATLTNEDPLESVLTALRGQLGLKNLAPAQSLQRLLQAALEQIPQNTLVLVLDQFEQFYLHNPQLNEQAIFTRQLLDVVQSPTTRLLIATRADSLYRVMDLLGVLRRDGNYFELKKFSIPQVIRIFQYIANQINAEFDDVVVEKLVERDMADEESSVAAADIQIMALMLQARQHRMSFTEQSFQQAGGIQRLFQDYVEKELSTPNSFNQDNAVLYTLLALVDADQNRRAGRLTEAAIDDKLKQSVRPLGAILTWLVNRRLISRIDEKNQPAQYELAHERLIEPLRIIENKSEAGPRQTSALLDRRTNEWLGNGRIGRYLLPWSEYRQIKRWEPLLTWGEQRQPKKDLLRASWRRMRNWGITGTGLLLLLGGWWGVRETTYHQLTYQAPNELELIITNYLQPGDKTAVLDSLGLVDPEAALLIADVTLEIQKDEIYSIICEGFSLRKLFQRARTVADSIPDPDIKATALEALSEEMAKVRLFQQARAVATSIVRLPQKANALRVVAIEMAKANVKEYPAVFQQARTVTDSIDISGRATILEPIVIGMAKAGLYQQARITAISIPNLYLSSKAKALGAIATEMAKTKVEGYEAVFQEALTVADSIRYPYDYEKANFILAIAVEMAKARVEGYEAVFQEARIAADSIRYLYNPNESKVKVMSSVAEEMAKFKIAGYLTVFRQSYTIAGLMTGGEQQESLQIIAKKMAEAGLFQQARIIANDIEEPWKPEILKEIVREMAEAGLYQQARVITESAEKTDIVFQSEALQIITREIAKTGRYEQARAFADSIADEYKDDVRQAIAKEMAIAGQYQQASSIYGDLRSFNHETKQVFVREMAKAGQFQKALTIADLMAELPSKADALLFIAIKMAKAETKGYPGVFQRALNCCNSLDTYETPYQKAHALRVIAVEMAKAKVDKYLSVFQQAITVANSIENIPNRPDFPQKSDVLLTISKNLADSQQFRSAYQTLKKIPNNHGSKGIGLIYILKAWRLRDNK